MRPDTRPPDRHRPPAEFTGDDPVPERRRQSQPCQGPRPCPERRWHRFARAPEGRWHAYRWQRTRWPLRGLSRRTARLALPIPQSSRPASTTGEPTRAGRRPSTPRPARTSGHCRRPGDRVAWPRGQEWVRPLWLTGQPFMRNPIADPMVRAQAAPLPCALVLVAIECLRSRAPPPGAIEDENASSCRRMRCGFQSIT